MGGNEPLSSARSCLQLMGSANLKVDCFDDVGRSDVAGLLESRLRARDVSFAEVREREAVGFFYRYLEFIAGENRVKPTVVLPAKVCIGIAESHYSVETPRPLDNRLIQALGSIGGGDRDHTIFGGDAVQAVE